MVDKDFAEAHALCETHTDHFVLAGTINFETREEDFVLGQPMTLAELSDRIAAVIEGKPQATSFVFGVARKSV